MKKNKGMKVNCNFCGYEYEKNREKCFVWGKYVISVRVEIILSLNVRKYMQCCSFKMVMMMMMISGLWL